jgi:hypothetical protein
VKLKLVIFSILMQFLKIILKVLEIWTAPMMFSYTCFCCYFLYASFIVSIYFYFWHLLMTIC